MPKQTFFNLPDEKRNKIIQIATDEFARHTYSKASLSKIVTRAGIAKGSMYQYFEDKKDLFMFILNMAAEEKIKYIEKHGVNLKEDFFIVFEKTMLAGVEFGLNHPSLGKIMANAMEPFAEKIFKELNEKWKPVSLKFYEDLIKKGKAEGSIREEVNERLVAHMLVGMIGVGLPDYILEAAGVSMEEFLKNHGSQSAKLSSDKIRQVVKDIISIVRQGLMV